MAEINLIVTIPDDPQLQAKIVEAVEYLNRTQNPNDGTFTIPDMSPADVKKFLEERIKTVTKRELRRALKDKATTQAESFDF